MLETWGGVDSIVIIIAVVFMLPILLLDQGLSTLELGSVWSQNLWSPKKFSCDFVSISISTPRYTGNGQEKSQEDKVRLMRLLVTGSPTDDKGTGCPLRLL